MQYGFTFFLLIILLFVLSMILFQKTKKCSSSLHERGPIIVTEPQTAGTSYENFSKEEGIVSLEDELEEKGVTGTSTLSNIYNEQERQNKAFFHTPRWKKNAVVPIRATRNNVLAVIINRAETLTAAEQNYLKKTGIKLGYLFTCLNLESIKKMRSIHKGGGEIYLSLPPEKNTDIPYVGLIKDSQKGRLILDQDYLVVPKRQTKFYGFFTYPLVQELKTFNQRKKSLILLTPRPKRIRNFYDWAQRQKRSRSFLPPSQLISGVTFPRKTKPLPAVQVKKIIEAQVKPS